MQQEPITRREIRSGVGGDEQSESPTVPTKAGNPVEGTRWREGAAFLQNHGEET